MGGANPQNPLLAYLRSELYEFINTFLIPEYDYVNYTNIFL